MKTPTIFLKKEIPQVGSFLLVCLVPISDEGTFYTIIFISNSKISLMVIMTKFGALCLAGAVCTSNYQRILFLTVVWYLKADLCLLLMKTIEKIRNLFKILYLFSIYNVMVYHREASFGYIYW